jgi:hypothetical protein
MADISNTDDVIDSRDVIARFEELTESRKPFYAGWNMPGYMPDNEPARFQTWEDAREYIVGEMESFADQNDQQSGGNPGETSDDVDARNACTAELRARAAAIRDMEEPKMGYGETIGAYHYFIDKDEGIGAFDSEAECREWCALRDLIAEASGYAADWEYGETLIRDSYFKEYAQELAEDCAPFPAKSKESELLNSWPYRCIDWDQAARELQMDYTAVDFDGVTYWVR